MVYNRREGKLLQKYLKRGKKEKNGEGEKGRPFWTHPADCWAIHGPHVPESLLCMCLFFGLSLNSLAQTPQPTAAPTPPSKGTVYTFEAEDLTGKGKGPNNVFLKVGVMKKQNLLQMRLHFRKELRDSLKLVK